MRHRWTLLTLIGLATLPAGTAGAHPFAKDTYSLYNALRVGEGTVSAVVVLEVPRTVVLADIQERIEGGEGKRKAVKNHDQSRFETLAKGLTLQIAGEPVQVEWRPLAHPSNGKAVEDFFMYWVGAEVPIDASWGESLSVELSNTAYAKVDMVYSGTIQARGEWSVDKASTVEVLGVDPASLERNDPKAWSDDARLRTVSGTWSR